MIGIKLGFDAMGRWIKLYLYALGAPKTLLFNFRYLPWKHAIRLPIFVSHRVWLRRLSGRVTLSEIKTGAVRIGFDDVGLFDPKSSRTIWMVSGLVEFQGEAAVCHGSKFVVSGTLSVGRSFFMSSASAIVAQRHVSIGDDVLISWDVLIMDGDGHRIYDANGKQRNSPMPVMIGNKVWVGCRTLILKGVHIADGVVVAAASTVSKSITASDSIVAGNPAKVVREHVRWEP